MSVATGSAHTNSNRVPVHSSHLTNGHAHPPSPLRLHGHMHHHQHHHHSRPEPFMRVDTLGMKTRLLDVLKERDADVYMRDLGLFLTGKLRRDEWEGLMGDVLDSSLKRHLHNQLLTALLHNASCTSPISSTPTLPLHPSLTLTLDPSFGPTDPDALQAAQTALLAGDNLKPRRRVRKWVLGMKRDEKERVKGLSSQGFGMCKDDAQGSSAITEMNRGWQGSSRKRKFLQTFEPTSIPYCQTTGVLPCADELQVRLQAMATERGLPRGCAEDLGEFVSVALETHLDGLFYAAWQMIQANPTEDFTSEATDPATNRPTSQMGRDLPSAIIMEAGSSNDTSPSDISDSLPVRAEGTAEQEDADVEMADADVAGPPSVTSPEETVPEPLPLNPFPHRVLTLRDLQSLLLSSPNLLPHASSSLYKLQTNIYTAFEAEEQVAERLSRERDDRYRIKQAQVVAQYQKEFEDQSKMQAQELLREREMRMINAGAKRRAKGPGLSLGGSSGRGFDVKPKLEGIQPETSAPSSALVTGGSKVDTTSSATPITTAEQKAATVKSGKPDAMVFDVPDTISKAQGSKQSDTPSSMPAPSRPSTAVSSHSRSVPTGTPGVGGIILRPSARAKLADMGYTGPLGGNGVGLLPVAASTGMAGELQAMALSGSSRSVNPAVEQLKREMLYHDVLKPVPLPAAADIGKEGGPAHAEGVAAGLTGDALMAHLMAERDREEGERQTAAVMSAMSGLPVHTGNHWAYVDPALLLRDVLG